MAHLREAPRPGQGGGASTFQKQGWSTGKLKGLPRRSALADETFDVFFSYNSEDRDRVREIRQALEARGVRVWMDEQQINPGARWMEVLQEIIPKASASAIFLGPHGLGPWQKPEIEACIDQNVEREMPVVPIPLPELPDGFKIPPFLKRFSWVDLRRGSPPEELDRLARALGVKEPIPPPPAGSAPRIHNLPFLPLGDLLKGRDEELQRLITNLQSSAQATAITQAIHGLGGIGKTRLAVEYAWRSGDRYDTALFVVAESPEALRSGLAKLVQPLELPEVRTEAKAVEAVLAWLKGHSRWLLILDNIDTEGAAKAVRKILPRLGNGHVLLTSRRREWPPAVRKQPLGELNQKAARQLLLQRTNGQRISAKDDTEQANLLAETLGGLPLALEQASAYIAHYQTTFAKYLKNWELEREKVLKWHDSTVMDYPVPMAVTWQKTFSQLSVKAATILRLTAFLAPEPIPEELFVNGERILKKALGVIWGMRMRGRKLTIDDALAELAACSMATRSNGHLIVHRVVQKVLQNRIPKKEQRKWIRRSLLLVDSYSPSKIDNIESWPIWHALRPHIIRVLEEADRLGITSPTAILMNQLGVFLLNAGLYSQAEPLLRRALAIDEVLFEQNHPKIIADLNNLAQLLQLTNRLPEAEPLMRRVLESLDPKHSDFTIILNNITSSLSVMNFLSKAEPLMRQALALNEASRGPDDPQVAIDLHNLAYLLYSMGRFEEAEPLMERVMGILNPKHPIFPVALNNMASLLQVKKRFSEAEPLIRQALAMDEASFGPDHPNPAEPEPNKSLKEG